MADLVVELYGTRVGTLTGTWRTFDFVAARSAVEEFGIDSTILSVAIPLAAVPTRSHKARRQSFFRELLPEGQMLTLLAPQGRIHQEDFNQVLGTSGNAKYQKHGGRVSLARIAGVLSAVGDQGSLERLLRMTVVAVAVGNLDLHAKNISLLHRPDGSMTLAPAYDLVPQAHQPNDQEMALAVDQEYRHRAITRTHLVAEGTAWGLSDAERVVDHTLAAVLDTVTAEEPHPRAHPSLQDDITRFASNLVAGRAVGDPQLNAST